MLNIVLLEPEIPANTGNIGRTCVAAGARLHLIESMGFRISQKEVKRAGLDYWEQLDVTIYDNYEDFLEKNPGAKIYMATTKAHKNYAEVEYDEDGVLCIINEFVEEFTGIHGYKPFVRKHYSKWVDYETGDVFWKFRWCHIHP